MKSIIKQNVVIKDVSTDTWHWWVICFQNNYFSIQNLICQKKDITILIYELTFYFSVWENLSFLTWLYIAHISKFKPASIFQLIQKWDFSHMIYLLGIKATYCSSQEVPPLQDTCNATTVVTNSDFNIICCIRRTKNRAHLKAKCKNIWKITSPLSEQEWKYSLLLF